MYAKPSGHLKCKNIHLNRKIWQPKYIMEFIHYDDVRIEENSGSCGDGYEKIHYDVNIGLGGNTQAWCARKKRHISGSNDKVMVDFKIVDENQCRYPWEPAGGAPRFGIGTDGCQARQQGCALYKHFKDLNGSPVVRGFELHGGPGSTCKSVGYVAVGDSRKGCGGHNTNFCTHKESSEGSMKTFCRTQLDDPECRLQSAEGGAVWDKVVSDYCETHPGDAYCSCGSAAIEKELASMSIDEKGKNLIRARPECYSAKCSNYGYKNQQQLASQAAGCPPTKICSQTTSINGASNMVTGNARVMNCSDGPESQPVVLPQKKSFFTKKTVLILLVFLILVIMGVGVYFFSFSDTPSQYSIQSPI